jgi:enterochelin esterase family protein
LIHELQRKYFALYESLRGADTKQLLLRLTALLLTGCGLICCARAGAGGQQSSEQAQNSGNVKTVQTLSWAEEKPNVPRGKVESFTLEDKVNKRSRRLWVYTPPGYNSNSKAPYNLLICFDGLSYKEDIPAPTILDNLLAADRVSPTVAVMIDNEESRLEDLANRKSFADFMGDELIPWVRKSYRVTTDASRTALCGYSAGGLAAAYVAWRRPELFGNVLSQSGAFWRGNEGSVDEPEWLTHQFQNSPKQNLRFYIEVGALETRQTAGGPVFIEATRRLRQALEAKGYQVRYLEVANAGHDPSHWRSQLAGGLIYLFGR